MLLACSALKHQTALCSASLLPHNVNAARVLFFPAMFLGLWNTERGWMWLAGVEQVFPKVVDDSTLSWNNTFLLYRLHKLAASGGVSEATTRPLKFLRGSSSLGEAPLFEVIEVLLLSLLLLLLLLLFLLLLLLLQLMLIIRLVWKYVFLEAITICLTFEPGRKFVYFLLFHDKTKTWCM